MKFPFDVIYEDNHLLVVSKEAGLLVQADSTGDPSLVEYGKEYLKRKFAKPGNVFLGVAHRIDRPVSGILVMARTSKALVRLNAIFKERRVNKEYWAIIENRPPRETDTLVHWIKKDHRRNVSKVVRKGVTNSLRCELSYELIAHLNNRFLLRIFPLTGRAHQIRVQLSVIGSPVQGDLKYGYRGKMNRNKRSIGLHARKLTLEHPVRNEKMSFVAPLPKKYLWEVFSELEVGEGNR